MTHFALVNPPGEYHSPKVGGAVATVNYNIALSLQRAGHDVTVFSAVAADEGYDRVRVVPLVDVKQISRVKRKLAHWEAVRRSYNAEAYGVHIRSLGRELRRSGPIDVAITHNDLRSGAQLRRSLPAVRWVPWLHNEAHGLTNDAVEGIGGASLVVCVSNYIKTWTLNRYGLSADQFVVALNGVDTEFFTPGDRLRLRDGRLRVLFVGRLSHDKGADTLVDAVAAVQREGLSAEVTVLGSRWWYGNDSQLDDWYAGGLITQIVATGGTWHPHTSRSVTAKTFREHDVVGVLSRSQDPAPLVTLEAMASGCAVIASNRGGIPELVGDAASIVAPDDVRGVTEILSAWCANREELVRVRQHSLEHARRMTWDDTASHFLSALDRRPG